MEHLELTTQEFAAELELVESLAASYSSVENEEFLAEAWLRAHDLPERVRRFLGDFRAQEQATCMIKGHPINDDLIGPTPSHWRTTTVPSTALRYEMLVVLYASLIGDLFGWATQQDGHLVHEVFPIPGHELEQLGSGSETLLTWHTEDAFHPCRGDYLVLACLRNPDRVATMVGQVDDLQLRSEDLEVLSEERFVIRPDESHLPRNNSDNTAANFSAIQEMETEPAQVSVLYGHPERPYLRTDPYFMEVHEDPVAAEALDRFIDQMDRRISHLVLEPGDFLFLDNCRVVHGREPFKARFDGTDRWLKRVNVTRDLRKSHPYRSAASLRVIG